MGDDDSGVVARERGVSPFRADFRLYAFIIEATVTTGLLLFFLTSFFGWTPLRVVQTAAIAVLLVGSFLLPGVFRVRNELTSTVARQLFAWRVGGGVLFAAIGVARDWIDTSAGGMLLDASLSTVAWGGIEGLILGSVGGYLALHGRQQAQHADRLVEQTAVLNRVLRHDIRTAVNLIEGNLELVDPETETGEKRLASAVTEARELSELGDRARNVQQLLRNDHTTSLVDLVPFVEEVVADVQETHPEARITIESPEEAIAATNTIITEAIRELVENAIEHSDQSTPTVQIELAEGGQMTTITVQDDGPGISTYEAEILEQGAVTDLQHSSGMGLWLVRWVVDQSRGTLDITSHEPRGTAVTIQLPTP